MTSAHNPEDVRIFHKECCSLARAGYNVTLVERGDSYEKSGVHIVGIGSVTGGRLYRMTKVTKQVYAAALQQDADIYHIHDPELLPYGLRLKRKGKKVIFDSHENTTDQILEKTWIPKLIRLPLCWLFDRYQKRVCRRLDAVISVSPHICEYYASFHSRVAMVTNYPVYEETPLPDGSSKKIGFAGGISPQWNHACIIRALPQTEATYVLAGVADDGYMETLKSLPGWDRVEFRGKIPHEAVGTMLRECGIGVSILDYSYNTGMRRGTLGNTKIYEQMMAGLPVICSASELWKQMVEKYHCGICVEPGNVDEIAEAIRYLLDHPDEARSMGENGRRAVKERFNWGVEEQKLLALYREIWEG